MRMRSLALGGLFAIACMRPAPSGQSQSAAPPSVSIAQAPTRAPSRVIPPPSSRSPSKAAAQHRVNGPIEGRFVPASSALVAGEPIVIQFSVRPTTAPLRVFVGGDGRNAAGYPTRVAVKAVDVASGATVCDNVASAPFPSFGGIGSEQVLAKGAWLRDAFVLNPACPGIAKPGVYRVTLHRRITDLDLKIKKPGAAYPTSCDVHPIHEGPVLISGEPACEKLLDAVPWVTSVFELSIAPFDAAIVRRAVESGLSAPDEMTRHRIVAWACGWIGCGCSKRLNATDAEVIAALPKALPSTFPKACP
jgi:hypothetical protein